MARQLKNLQPDPRQIAFSFEEFVSAGNVARDVKPLLMPEAPSPPVPIERVAEEQSALSTPSENPSMAEDDPLPKLLCEISGRPLKIAYTNNRRKLVSFRDYPGGARHVRLSLLLKEAPDEVHRELGMWLRDHKRYSLFAPGTHSGRFIRQPELQEGMQRVRRPPARLQTRGEIHDLQAMFDDLNARFFGGACDARVGWTRLPHVTGRGGIRLGSYNKTDNAILIHPAMDWVNVPKFVIQGTLFHEMTHWQLRDKPKINGRAAHHDREFYSLASRWPRHEDYESWVRGNSAMLVKRRNRLVRNERK